MKAFSQICCTVAAFFVVALCLGQPRGPQSVFAHNDYLKPQPFHAAYAARVGYIEADVFLEDNNLLVAHTRGEINPTRNIEVMYFKPLSEKINANGGHVYPDSSRTLHLMVDIKTEAIPTLRKLIEILSVYPDLTNCGTLFITISGNMPAPPDWSWVPLYVHFDGRIGVVYDKEQLARVPLISMSFRNYSKWKGRRELDPQDRGRLTEAITAIHLLEKPVRFWATPDTQRAWEELSNLGVDVINTDDVAGAVRFVNSR